MTPGNARKLWKALMDNASALISDAHTLLGAGSFGRTRSLTVLAQEELGKALWLYDTFELNWSNGSEEARSVPNLTRHGRDHLRKYMEAASFGDELAAFWGNYSGYKDHLGDSEQAWREALERRQQAAREAALRANEAKQHGFYVDFDEASGAILSPSQIDVDVIAQELQTAAQVVEMLLIKDHTRMQHEAVTAFDSTHVQQSRLLPISHPDDWEASSEGFKGQSDR